MFRVVYNLVFHAVYLLMLPHFLLRMRRRGGYRKDFGERLFRISEDKRRRLSDGRRIWIHAVSVGELGVGLAFRDAWRRRHPEARFVCTVNTSTAHRIAEEKLGAEDVLLYPPLDSPSVVGRALDAIRPEALVLVETELWPNLLWAARRRGVPTLLLNGRMSDRSFRRLRKVRFFTRRVYGWVDRFCLQSAEDARRMRELGAPEERVRVMHSVKYDGLERNEAEEAARRKRLEDAGFLDDDTVVVLGSSTWPGEERMLMEAVGRLRESAPGVRLILVPRHAERRAEVLADAETAGMKLACWSEAADPGWDAADAVMIDTTGELRHFTGIADRVVVGKSFFRREGQNPLEAAFAGKWILTGPGMDNFRQVMADLRSEDAVTEVADAGEVERVLRNSLEDRGDAEARGRRASEVVARRRGGLARSVEELESLIRGRG